MRWQPSVKSTTATRFSISIAAYRGGFDTADPVDVYSNTSYKTVDTTVEAASITVSASNSPLIVVGGYYISNTATTATAPASPGTFAEDLDFYDATGDYGRFFYSQVVASGATGDMDVVLSGGGLQLKHAFGIALNPAP